MFVLSDCAGTVPQSAFLPKTIPANNMTECINVPPIGKKPKCLQTHWDLSGVCDVDGLRPHCQCYQGQTLTCASGAVVQCHVVNDGNCTWDPCP